MDKNKQNANDFNSCDKNSFPCSRLKDFFLGIPVSRLQSVYLVNVGHSVMGDLRDNISDRLREINTLRRLTININPTINNDVLARDKDIRLLVTKLNSTMSVLGRLALVDTFSDTTWFWDAGRGRVLI